MKKKEIMQIDKMTQGNNIEKGKKMNFVNNPE